MRGISLALLLLSQDPTKVEEQSPLTVQPIHGALSVWRFATDKVEPLDKPGRVLPSDRLGTAGGDGARFSTEGPLLVYLRGIRVAGGKGLALERKAGKLVLKLYKGTVVVESYESEIELETPFGKATGKQVYFMATVDEKSARVVALDGKMVFSNDLGSVTIADGTSAAAEKGKAPDPPKPMNPPETELARAAESDGNLLRNPGFEQRLDDWLIDFLPAQEDFRVFRSGRKSLRVSLKDVGASQPALPGKAVRGVLKPGAQYLLRFYVRSEGFLRDGKPAAIKLSLDRSGKGDVSDTKHHFEVPGSEGAWSARRFTFEATGPDLWFCIYTGSAAGPYQGTVWYDDFFLTEFPRRMIK